MNLTVQTDRNLVRAAGNSLRHVLLSFTAPEPTRGASRPAVNLAFVIDRSGSMGGRKIELARAAVTQALRMLRDSDRFSVVSYDNEIDVVGPSTQASAEAVRNAIRQVETIQARGNTDLAGGWLKGCEQIAEHLKAEETGRCLLLSDGLANQGITDRDELARHAEALGGRGIRTSCLGIGDDYDERLLSGISSSSGGHFYHIETAVQMPDILTSEIGEALEVVARDVIVAVRPPAGVSVTTLNSYRVRPPAGGSFVVQLGDLTARQEVSLVFALKFPAAVEGEVASVLFSVSDAAGALSAPESDVAWTFAEHRSNDTQPRNVAVDRAVAQLYAAAARADALELNRAGRFADAMARLEAAALRVEKYAGSDAQLCRIIAELRERHEAYSAPMSAMRSKQEFAASRNISSMRDASGKARRRPNT